MIKYTEDMSTPNGLAPLDQPVPRDQAKKPNIKEVAERIARRALEILKKKKGEGQK